MTTTAFTNGVTLTDAAWFNDVDTATYPLTSVSGTNTITATGPSSLSSYASGQVIKLIPAATNSGATTINVSGLGAKNVFANGSACTGGELVIGVPNLLYYDGTQFNIVGYQRAASAAPQIQPITATVAANAMTLGYAGGSLDFRSATAGSGTVSTVTVASITTVISSGSTGGTSSGAPSRIWLAVINNAGTGELAWMNTQLGSGQIAPVDESFLISTTAEGGAGAADSAGVWYSTTARTGVAFRLVGFVESTQATAGTWATSPSKIQGMGPNVKKPGEVVQRKRQQSGAFLTSGTTVVPFDNTIPQNTEGDSLTSVLADTAITPTSDINQLDFSVGVNFAASAASATALCLFQDSTANALAVSAMQTQAAGASANLRLGYSMRAATTSSTTFKLRIGNSGGNTTYINGASGAQLFGGTMISEFNIEERMA